MGLKKRTKVSAEFNMSSLTDIIFLLLIFFMLTSTIVAPNALNLKLPSSSSSTRPISPSNIDDVRISTSGRFYFNGRRVSESQLIQSLRNTKKRKGSKASVTISPDKNTPTKYVVFIMDQSKKLNIDAILTVGA